jgi:uncharacterized membrane protein YidH (DUF202 family)
MKTLGTVLVAIGVLALIYGGLDYNRNRNFVDMGSMEMSAAEDRSMPIPEVAVLAMLVGGIAFLVVGARRGAHWR